MIDHTQKDLRLYAQKLPELSEGNFYSRYERKLLLEWKKKISFFSWSFNEIW
jgi:hypothetical protein